MLKRESAENGQKVKLSFVIAHNPEQGRVSVVGDFNEWDPNATKLVKRANNTRSASIVVDAGQRYAFRYRTEDGEWFNDDAADAYESNEHGTENSIVVT
jgi:1,4-alpha-glucan branching enzyme